MRLTPQFLRALHVGASGRSPIMGVRPDAPTSETIVSVTFYEIIIFTLNDSFSIVYCKTPRFFPRVESGFSTPGDHPRSSPFNTIFFPK